MENGIGMFGSLMFFGVMILAIAGMWKTFTKAGKPGWAIFIPIYNVIVMLQIAGRPMWWLLLMLIPVVNLVVVLVLALDIAKAFGKGAGFGFRLPFFGFVFYPILGFSDAEYSPAR